MNEFEIGPIRPPSESSSLLIRVTRGCHWNKCYFCGLYKSMKFSMRPIEDIISDIKAQSEQHSGQQYKSCFLQDGDALVLKTDYLLKILDALHQYFPSLESITTYARADSITRKSLSELKLLREHEYAWLLLFHSVIRPFVFDSYIVCGYSILEGRRRYVTLPFAPQPRTRY